LFVNRAFQSFVLGRLSQKTERESVKTLLKDVLHERPLLVTENTYKTVSSFSVQLRTSSTFCIITRSQVASCASM